MTKAHVMFIGPYFEDAVSAWCRASQTYSSPPDLIIIIPFLRLTITSETTYYILWTLQIDKNTVVPNRKF